jgi:proteasome lid subunit RPN8/RPN11
VHARDTPGLELGRRHVLQVIAHAWDGAPDEACGLLVGRGRRVEVFVPCRNTDRSSRTFSIGPDGWRAADEAVDARPGEGRAVIGVVHSHTHTEAYPSPTDVDKAGSPLLVGWHWVLVSLRPPAPVVRSYVIDGGNIVEEPVVLVGE